MCAEMERYVNHGVPCVCNEQNCEVRFHSSRDDTVKSEQWFCCGGKDACIRGHLCGLSDKAVSDSVVAESAGLCHQDSIFFFAFEEATGFSKFREGSRGDDTLLAVNESQLLLSSDTLKVQGSYR
jgi:hypothetical protein